MILDSVMATILVTLLFGVITGQSLIKREECGQNLDLSDLNQKVSSIREMVVQSDIYRQNQPEQNKETTKRVIFSAYLEEHYITKGNDHLIFSKIIVNEGNDYNGTTGTFTCTIPGLYQFNWMIHKTSGTQYTVMYLMQNSDIKFYTHVDTIRGNLPGTAYLYVREGDTVWIRWEEQGAKLYADDFSSFSGLLIQI